MVDSQQGAEASSQTAWRVRNDGSGDRFFSGRPKKTAPGSGKRPTLGRFLLPGAVVLGTPRKKTPPGTKKNTTIRQKDPLDTENVSGRSVGRRD